MFYPNKFVLLFFAILTSCPKQILVVAREIVVENNLAYNLTFDEGLNETLGISSFFLDRDKVKSGQDN